MPSGSRKRRKRGRARRPGRSSGTGAAVPPSARQSLERGYARARAKDEEARGKLVPLAEGERPTAVTFGALLALLLGLANLVLYLAGLKIAGKRPGPFGIGVYSGLLLLTAWGMWRARYWAVLGMQALLALTILGFGLLIVRSSDVGDFLIALAVIAGAGTLFWFLVKAMARIQMPERPGAKR